MKISEVLLNAADRLTGRWVPKAGTIGWVPKAGTIGQFGTLCAAQAIAHVLAEAPGDYQYKCEVYIRHYLQASVGVPYHIALWNDQQTCEADVQHALRLAALEAASEGR